MKRIVTMPEIDRAACLALAERVEAGESGRDMGREIWDALGRQSDAARAMKSLDACKALQERVLPQFDWVLARMNGGLTVHCQMGPEITAYADTPEAAFCAAILRAVAQEGRNDG